MREGQLQDVIAGLQNSFHTMSLLQYIYAEISLQPLQPFHFLHLYAEDYFHVIDASSVFWSTHCISVGFQDIASQAEGRQPLPLIAIELSTYCMACDILIVSYRRRLYFRLTDISRQPSRLHCK
jgi:hypothetical protein